MKIYITLVTLCTILISCKQQENKVMTLNEAYNYKISLDNNCDSSILIWQGQYCDQAVDLYNDVNIKVQNKVLQDTIIQELLTKAQDFDCKHDYPKPALCIAVDIRANEIVMKAARELGISADPKIFDVSSASIQRIFDIKLNNQQKNQEANKLLLDASESEKL